MKRFVGLWVLTAVAAAGCARTPTDMQRDYANSLRPTDLSTVPAAATAPARTVRVRIYADPDYRRRIGWREHVRGLLARAEEVTVPQFGVRFRIEEVIDWEARLPSNDLVHTLETLEREDPGRDVDLVIGFVSALPGATADLHALGYARLFGKHFVVRGMENAAELDHFADLRALPEDERQSVYLERLAHKEVTIFLHEWGHVLGALHVRDESCFMVPEYDRRQARFSDYNAALIRLGLDHSAVSPPDHDAWRAAHQEWVSGHPWDGLDSQALAELDAPPRRERRRRGSGLQFGDTATYNAAVNRLNDGKLAEAWEVIQGLARLYPEEPSVRALGCVIAARHIPHESAATDVCELAAVLDPDDLAPLAAMARIRVARGEADAAAAQLWAARERVLDRVEGMDGEADAIASLFLELNWVSAAEQIVASLPAGERRAALSLHLRYLRRRCGLAPGVVPVESEATYVAGIERAYDALYDNALDDAAARADAVLAQFAATSGALALRCAARVYAGRPDAGSADCAAALAAYDETVLAHSVTAALAKARRDYRIAAEHFERVTALTPRDASAYRQLAEVYTALGDNEAADEVRRRYAAQIDEPF